MSDVYKLTQKSVWTNNIGRHTTWYLLDEHKMGYYIDYIEWSVKRDWGFLRLDSECMAFRYNGKKGCVTSWSECATVRWLEHPEYDEFLREFVPGHGQGEIIDEFKKRSDIRLRVTQLKDRESTLSLKQGTYGGRFAPGTVPPNKGLKLTDYVKDEAKLANIRRCQFKKGDEVHNECPIGTERVSRDGYIEVKVPKEDADDRAHGW